MDGMTGHLISLGARLVVFSLVVYVASRKNPKITLHRPWVAPLFGLCLAALDGGLYWALKPILNLATLGALGLLMPLVVNVLFVLATLRAFTALARGGKPWFAVDGVIATAWLAGALTVVHGALWLGLDYLPSRI